jgi:hypothetical protein
MKYKTKWTDADMSYFSGRVYYWQKAFGLHDWAIRTSYTQDDDDYAAVCRRDIDNRAALITFNVDTTKPASSQARKDLNYYALHEVLHLLLADISRPKLKEKHRDLKEHQVVRKIEAYILGLVR